MVVKTLCIHPLMYKRVASGTIMKLCPHPNPPPTPYLAQQQAWQEAFHHKPGFNSAFSLLP
jgi:hypothetical protein